MWPRLDQFLHGELAQEPVIMIHTTIHNSTYNDNDTNDNYKPLSMVANPGEFAFP